MAANVSSGAMDANDRAALRHKLIEQRLALPNRLACAAELQEVLRVWLLRRRETTIGAYWPIKGEFDPLPALYRWSEDHPERRIGLPVVDKAHGTLRFHVWYPGCPMEEDAFHIPKPKDTEQFQPQLMLVPCLGFGPCGLRLGYGGGFMDRTLAELDPRPAAVGIGYAHGFLPLLKPSALDVPLDAMLTEEGVVWDREG
ncbi:5-formyltetrahydrofolate cyclo-ligase [Pelomonas cellulosilytica]|uniref:5-formyltetrahydrofolate cyclo-ligase n=1 Tax=Pelomonas cellulosilytica TaxID=2906762 RepID=A0ABS8XS92_9BURK|nr:5-formyltetrahydrofolate cyclo-ligase [Pelomonas sp. P8]MCE4554043.1 5-formyltetrahydrofolate cyclo-ligase [Pelomonas sp. P8]